MVCKPIPNQSSAFSSPLSTPLMVRKGRGSQKEKPKQVGVKRKKQPAPAPSRRSSRVKELPKVNYDYDWEVEHFGKRRKLTEKKALSNKVEVVETPGVRSLLCMMIL